MQDVYTLKIKQEIGRRISSLRKSMGLTQGELGELLGLERSAVSAKERGQAFFNPAELLLLAEFFDKPVVMLISGEEPHNEVAGDKGKAIANEVNEDHERLITCYEGVNDEGKKDILGSAIGAMLRMQSQEHGKH